MSQNCKNMQSSINTDKKYVCDSVLPPIKKYDENHECIIDAVIRSTCFTSKFCNYCELSNTYYNEDDNGLIVNNLIGSNFLSSHHCYGCIQYHISNKELFEQANMYFECDTKIIQKQSWNDKKVKISRSNGKIIDSEILKDSPIRFVDNYIMLYVRFFENDEKYHKWVRLLDYYSEKNDINIKGLLSLNPELKNEELILTINNHPDWLNEYRDPWKELFVSELDNIDIKYKFIYE
jgi:hypothetical protein